MQPLALVTGVRMMPVLSLLALGSGPIERPQDPVGRIVDIRIERAVYHAGDTARFRVTVQNNTTRHGRYIVSLEVQGPGEQVLYDSHRGSRSTDHRGHDCVDLELRPGQSVTVRPFWFVLRRGAPSGTYHAIAGLRFFPWDGTAVFRGATWAAPEETFEVRP